MKKRHLGLGTSFGADMGQGTTHDMIAERLGSESHNLSEQGAGFQLMLTEAQLWLARQRDLRGVTASVSVSSAYWMDVVRGINEKGKLQWSKWDANHRKAAHMIRSLSREDDLVREGNAKWDIRYTYHLKQYTEMLNLHNLFCRHNIPHLIWRTNRPRERHYSREQQLTLKILEKLMPAKHFFDITQTHIDHLIESGDFMDPTPLDKPIPYYHTTVKVKDEHPTRRGNETWVDKLWAHSSEHGSFTKVD